MHIHKRMVILILTSLSIGLFALAFMTPDKFYVLIPVLMSFVVFFWLWISLWNRDRQIPFFDVGIFCALATLVYTVFPLINYWADGLQFGLFSDKRLSSYSPEPFDLGFFCLRHVLYLFSFAACYLLFRGSGTVTVSNVKIPHRFNRQVIVFIFLLLTMYFVFLQVKTGLNFNPSYEPDSYANYLAAKTSMPLLLLQISVKLRGLMFIFKIALLSLVVSQCSKKSWRIVLLIWIIVEIVSTLFVKGDRGGLVLFLMATALFYHRMIKPLSMKVFVTSGVSLFTFFIFLGLFRSYFDFSTSYIDLPGTITRILSVNNEFQVLLGTAYDVFMRKSEGIYLPWYLYINDFISILPPQQVVPFEKIRASEWYLRVIGMSGTGQGFMWGVISQSIVGLDWLELALRGALLGCILALFHRWYLERQTGFFETLVYVYFCIKTYNTFRDTTLSFLVDLVWVILPFSIIMRIGPELVRLLNYSNYLGGNHCSAKSKCNAVCMVRKK